MSFKFNPLTGQLDLVGSGASSIYYKTYIEVDAGFLTPRLVTLDTFPLLNSEMVFFNGLIMEDTCYTILGDELTFDPLLDIRVGDKIDIRYVG